MQLSLLWTDYLFFIFLLGLAIWLWWVHRDNHWQHVWHELAAKPMAMVSLVLIMAYMLVGALDSIHMRTTASNSNGDIQLISVLDWVIYPIGSRDELSYSSPLALHSYQAIYQKDNGQVRQVYPQLQQAGQHLNHASHRYATDITLRIISALATGLAMIGILTLGVIHWLHHRRQISWRSASWCLLTGQTHTAWRSLLLTIGLFISGCAWVALAGEHYYLLGTDQVGRSVFYQTVRSIRTGLLIGTLTTLIMLPLALLLGVAAGYFGGWIDDMIQFIYITLSSIPAVLLISAGVLAFQVLLANHPQWAPTTAERADLRLLGLCVILGITSWSSLCRLLRGETLKIRELEYVQASRALGASAWHMMRQHIMPNITHIVLITVVLDFSMLVLAEVVLSYIGVGVHPTMMSWGQMINRARLELARDPIVWWPLVSAFSFMFVFVLSINLFADALRVALDPTSRTSQQWIT